MRTSAIRNSWTLIQNARTMTGQESAKTCPLKNERWTAGQPGELTTIQPTTREEDDRADHGDQRRPDRALPTLGMRRGSGRIRAMTDQLAGVTRAVEQTGHVELDRRAVRASGPGYR